MAIYSPFGLRVNIKTARLVPVWIEHLGSEIKWHYTEKKPTKRTKELWQTDICHITAEDAEQGKMLWGGKEEPISSFRAEGGIHEIIAACKAVNPELANKEF